MKMFRLFLLPGFLVFLSFSAHSQEEVAENEVLSWYQDRLFNIDFGPWIHEQTQQNGPAAVGFKNDFWNIVGVPWKNRHTVKHLRLASRKMTPIEVELINLGGGWSNKGGLGVKLPMLDTYNYPMNNQGGDSEVILHKVPPGNYTLFLYGRGVYAKYYGDYTVTVGDREYGRKKTSQEIEAVEQPALVEGSQFVRFEDILVKKGETLRILIRPGGQITDPHGRKISDAMICGLQLMESPRILVR